MENAKDYPIKTYLSRRGINPHRERANKATYFSPLRSERTPSFTVDLARNLWYDFGVGEGGSIIDLVMRIENCSVAESYRRLDDNDFSAYVPAPPAPTVKPRYAPTKVISVDDITSPALISYLESRGISLHVANFVCSEVRYSQNGKEFFAIGFPSDAGGWELRNAYFKGCIGTKAPTIIKKRSTGTTIVLEGFMDLLSYAQVFNSMPPNVNVCVLNSVTNLPKALPYLSTQDSVYAFLDNDDAGRKAFEALRKGLPDDVTLEDGSCGYPGYKDLNEALCDNWFYGGKPKPKAK